MGAAYDLERGLQPYQGKDFPLVRSFFDERCCYCAAELNPKRVAQDHLDPMNKSALGLHAWGNVVAACQDCNHDKQGTPWRDFLIQRAKSDAVDRHTRLSAFIAKYKYNPDTTKLRIVAEELYDEVGSIAMTLINAKVKRLRDAL